jgi:hypothetical protein
VKYFGDSGQLANGNPDNNLYLEDQFNEVRIAYDHNGYEDIWWLRSPGIDLNNVVVYHTGSIDMAGGSVYAGYGVRPAMWVKLE